MFRLIISLLFFGSLLIAFSQQEKKTLQQLFREYKAAEQVFREAEAYASGPSYNENEEEKLYRSALAGYERLIPQMQDNDSLLFHVYTRTALIYYYFYSLEHSLKWYGSAIRLSEKLPVIPDSFLFKPYLYSGGIYYARSQFDSALYSYKKAEEIQEKYAQPLDGSQRLYNRLGVMYYETGNYRLAKNYFEKAISVLNASAPGDLALLVNYKINIASLLIKLEEYDEAGKLYQSILPYNLYTNEIYHNLGIIDLRKENYPGALAHFRKVDYGRDKKNIDLYYNLAMAYGGLNNKDSSEHYLSKAIAENQAWNASRRNVQYGLILKLEADRLMQQNKLQAALAKYQQAIMQFHVNYNDADPYHNPAEFGGIFSYLNLFNTLNDKANVFASLYEQSKDRDHLQAALDAYRSAFALAAYVERTYESDEARLFLNKIKHAAHSKPIDISIQLYELTKNKGYLEEAYFFDQLNKASTLSLNMQELRVKNELSSASGFFDEEAKIRQAISRLSLRSSQVTDSIEWNKLNIQIREHEIRLSRIRDELNDDPQYRERHFRDYIPPVETLFKLLDKQTAILSYHLSPGELLTLVITAQKLEYIRIQVDSAFYRSMDSLKSSLHTTSENKYSGEIASKDLYRHLILPLLAKLRSVNRLVIIPDDELHYLPFEALRDENNEYLLANYAVQYQYSTSLLVDLNKFYHKDQLAFAPFASRSYRDSLGNNYNRLPASIDEISDVRGKTFIDSSATRKKFLETAGKFGLIHLATHAHANNEQPNLSYIAFSPENDPRDYRLYAEEIYNLDLDSSGLIILSACETGSGQLIKGEGLMSLSRAFAYAGCPNIITSLWKAEDRTTAYIARKLHQYLQKGYSKDRALQQAKLDLLEDDQLDPRYKSPAFWAHLVFIGDYEKQEKTSRWIWIAGGLIIALLAGYFYKRRRKGKPISFS